MNSNKVIAEFMELPTEVFNSGNLNYYFKEFNSGTWYEEQELSYNISWDWLMPVIQKCLVGEAEQSEEISNTLIKNIYEGICNQDISFAHKSVIQFIKNYKNK